MSAELLLSYNVVYLLCLFFVVVVVSLMFTNLANPLSHTLHNKKHISTPHLNTLYSILFHSLYVVWSCSMLQQTLRIRASCVLRWQRSFAIVTATALCWKCVNFSLVSGFYMTWKLWPLSLRANAFGLRRCVCLCVFGVCRCVYVQVYVWLSALADR